MKYTSREIIAIRIGVSSAYISWNVLSHEPEQTSFNVYKISGNGIPIRINQAPVEGCTFYQDDHVDFSVNTFYFIRAYFSGKEHAPCKWFPLLKNESIQKTIPVIQKAVNTISLQYDTR